MIVIKFFDPAPLRAWIHGGLKMPAACPFEYFGDGGERPQREERYRVDNDAALADYLVHDDMLTFFTKEFFFSLMLFDNDVPSEIQIFDIDSGPNGHHLIHAEEIISQFAGIGADYAMAATFEECCSRNVLRKPNGGTMPVGKEIRRYVPGIYWLNYMSNELIGRHRVDLVRLRSTFSENWKDVGEGVMFKAYSKPDEWKQNKETVDNYLFENQGFFSINNVTPLGSARSDHSFVQCDDIFKQWP